MNRISIRGVTAVLATGGVVAAAGAVAVPAIAAASGHSAKPAHRQHLTTLAWGAGRSSAVDWQLTSAALLAKPKPRPVVTVVAARPRPVPARATRSMTRQPLTGSPQQIAQAMLLNRGWGEGQWSCLDSLWQRESGWNIYASNSGSGAYGIPQALPGSKMAQFGSDWATNPVTQIEWGLSYISSRYGTPCGAWAHSSAYGYY